MAGRYRPGGYLLRRAVCLVGAVVAVGTDLVAANPASVPDRAQQGVERTVPVLAMVLFRLIHRSARDPKPAW
eukprot:1029639-Rhodomonas_salina.2